METVENRLVFCQNPVLEGAASSRICKNNSRYELYPKDSVGLAIDFSNTQIESLDDIRDTLISMSAVGVHIMGSRGHIYHSKVLSQIVQEYVDKVYITPTTCLPRTFGLRARVREFILSDEGSSV